MNKAPYASASFLANNRVVFNIKAKRDYEAALREAERLWDAPAGSAKGDRLEVLVLLIQAYKTKHFPVPDPDPIDFLQHAA